MEPIWRITLFGPLRVQRGESPPVHFESRKATALLACLAFYGDRAQPRDLLTEMLWPDEDLEATRDRFRQALTTLRRGLEPADIPSGSILEADRATVRLVPGTFVTDTAEFETHLRAADRASHALERADRLVRALDLYTGELLPGFHEDWIGPERERLAEAYLKALHRAAETAEENGDLSQAIALALRAVATDPLREDIHADLMRYYAAAGRTADVTRQYRELERLLRDRLDSVPAPATRALLARLQAPASPGSVSVSMPSVLPSSSVPQETADWEPEGGAVPLDSTFYIVRTTDSAFETAVARRDSIVLVKGARQMGKTSLLARGLKQARQSGARVVLTDLQKLTAGQMASAEALFLTLAEAIADQLELDIAPEVAWNRERGWNVNFERFMRREVLGRLETPLVWGLDEVDRLFGCPFSAEVFGLFRAWHNERSLNPDGPWSRLTLAIAYATEAHLFITDLNQSPFNVGTRLALEDFTPTEVAELNRRYQSPLRDMDALTRFCALVGGNPYLVRRGLHSLTMEPRGIAAFEAETVREDGVYGDHLRRMLQALRQDVDLSEAVRALLRGGPCPTPDSFFRLRSAGVVVGTTMENARLRCLLYQRYLSRYLP